MKTYNYSDLTPDHEVWGEVDYWGFGSFISRSFDDVVENAISANETLEDTGSITVDGYETDGIFFSISDRFKCTVTVNIADWKARKNPPGLAMADYFMAIFGFRRQGK